MSLASSSSGGGLKGFLKRTGKWFYSSSLFVRDTSTTLARFTYSYGGKLAFAAATTSMVVLMPLMFEIAREGQVGDVLCCDVLRFRNLSLYGY